MSTEKKTFRCRLGFHRWYIDSAHFYSVHRCALCETCREKESETMLSRERELWGKCPEDLDFTESYFWVMERLTLK